MTLVVEPEVGRPSAPKLRVLLVAAYDEVLHAHTRLRQRALERLGSTVTMFDLLGNGNWLTRWRRAGVGERLERAIAQASPDLVLVLEGGQLEPAVVTELRQRYDGVWANWFSEGRRSLDAIHDLASSFDVVFVGGTTAAARLTETMGASVRYLPPGCDPSVHRPLRSRDQFRANVVFAGSATPYREQVLAELVEFGLAVWGPGWRRTKLRDYCRGELLEHNDYVRAYAGASVAVDVPWDAADVLDSGCTRRIFELAAIGIPQISFGCGDVERHFDPGTELLTCNTAGDLKTLTAELLHNRPWAEQLAHAARQRALSQHTYVHRMRCLLEAVAHHRDAV